MISSFERIARRWLETKEKGQSERYSKQSIARMEKHVFPVIGALPLVDITIPDVVELIEVLPSPLRFDLLEQNYRPENGPL